MELPLSSAPCLAHFDATSGFVNVKTANSTPTVVSIIDAVSAQPAVQLTIGSEPTFKSAGLDGRPDLRFGGSANLQFNSIASEVGTSFGVFVVGSVDTASNTNQDLFTLSQNGSAVDGYVRLMVNSSALKAITHNNSGTEVSISGGTVSNSTVFVASLLKDAGAGTLTLRLNGTTVASAGITGAFTFDRCTLGALNAGGSVSHNLTGDLSEVALFGGPGSYIAIEAFLLAKYGISINVNSGL